MTLRQQYARPRPRAIARHPASRAEPISPPPRQPGLGAQLPQQPSQPGQAVPIAALRPGTCPRPRACHRLNPRGVATQIRPLHLFPAARARRGGCRSCRHPAPPVSITGVLPAACAAGSVSSGLLLQVAGIGPLPVGVLWVSCRPLRVVNPPRRS